MSDLTPEERKEGLRVLNQVTDAARAYFHAEVTPEERERADLELDRAIAEANAYVARCRNCDAQSQSEEGGP